MKLLRWICKFLDTDVDSIWQCSFKIKTHENHKTHQVGHL